MSATTASGIDMLATACSSNSGTVSTGATSSMLGIDPSNIPPNAGDWKLVANTRFRKQEWELYNLRTDRTERVNLINQRADKAQELKAMWEAWAKRANVLPKPSKKPKKNKNKK